MWLIPLTKGKFACVDDCDIERLSRHSWYAMQPKREQYPHKWYAATRTEKRIVLMHRMITDAPPASHVDHQDNDGLHNRRGNLRVCTPSQNSGNRGPSRCNKLGLKGVARMGKRFVAYYQPNRRKVHLGCFGTAEEAAKAYDAAAREYYGEFAKTNFPVSA